MALDDLPRYGSGYERVQTSVKRTIEWGKGCKGAKSNDQQLFAIIQGGLSSQLRRKCAERLVEIGFDGYGIGGLSIGEPKEAMYRALEETIPLIPGEKPRYLMGVGSPMEILEAISLGIDIFDSAFPTRNARHNTAYTKEGRLNLTKGKFREDFSPLEEGCRCTACRGYTRAYISHLLKVRETLGMKLMTVHNIHFLQEVFRESREAIERGEFTDYKNSFRGYR
jgi:queuine tRNA-ribosyltransferase